VFSLKYLILSNTIKNRSESDKTDSRPLEKKKSVPFEKIMDWVAVGNRHDDILSSLAARLARIDREIGDKEKIEIKESGEAKPLRQIINQLLDAIDPDKITEKAREMFAKDEPTDDELKKAKDILVQQACVPFDNPKFRNALTTIKKRTEQIIDVVSTDEVTFAGIDEKAKEKARNLVDTFKKFIEDNKDELTALQIIYSKPYRRQHLTLREIKELAEAIEKPPYRLTQENLWNAYQLLEQSKVRGAGAQKLLTNIISLIRFALGKSDVLEPFSTTVDARFNTWLTEQERAGRIFSVEQKEWLTMIKDHIATSMSIEMNDFDLTPFQERGGRVKVYNVFGESLGKVIEELNEVLAA